MKLLVKPNTKEIDYDCDGLILPLKDFAVEYDKYYTIDEILEIRDIFPKEIFIVMNRMFFNSEIDVLKEKLLEIEQLHVTGIFFYDLSILELKKKLDLKTNLVWNATFMVTNYKTCNFYQKLGVKYANLSNEITFEEVKEIIRKSDIIPMFTIIGRPAVATSRRKLLSNYAKIHNLEKTDTLKITEKISKKDYYVKEDEFGTTFFYGNIVNNISCMKELKILNIPYIIINEEGLSHDDLKEIITLLNKGQYKMIEKLIGNETTFLNKETIFKVKKDEKN